MKQGTKIAIGTGLVLGVGALFLAGSAAAEEPKPGLDPEWKTNIRRIVAQIETVTGAWPGLADYFIAVAYWESSPRDGSPPNPNACREPCGPNSERGLLQEDPRTAGVESNPDVLFNPTVAIVAGTDLVYRLATKYTPEVVKWRGIRRGWKFPKLVADFDESDPESPGISARFAEALAGVGLPASFMNGRALPATVSWPGISAIEQAVGIG